MAIPDYCDERAEKYFRTGFVGSSHGDNGTSYSTSWDSTKGAKETKMVVFGYQEHVCAYCGNKGLPLQPRFTSSFDPRCDSTVTGYACVCKDAMDEVEVKEQLKAMRAKHHDEENLLEKKLPKVNRNVLKRVADLRVKSLKKEIDRGHFLQDTLASFEIEIKG